MRSTAGELGALAEGAAPEHVMRISALAHVMREWADSEDLDALAIQCWTAMEE